MKINIITLFPEYFVPLTETSVVGRAHKQGIFTTEIVNLRNFGIGQYQQVDDRPFGGGAGMVLMVEPIDKALESLGVRKGQANSQIVLTSARGKQYTQSMAREYSSFQTLTFICGHYEGVDERVVQLLIDDEVRIGDYVLSGGEPAVSVMVDTIIRQLPGTLGNEQSTINESHDTPGQIAAAQYTRPAVYKDTPVPEILLSGNHNEIKLWRRQQRKQH